MHASSSRSGALDLGCPPLAGILLATGVVLAAALLQAVPAFSDLLQWSRGASLGLSWITAHLCHWSWNHLVWDVVVFAILSLLALRLFPSRYAWCLGIAAIAIILEIQWNQHELAAYRGLSGIDCALFALIVAALCRHEHNPTGKFLALTATLAFLAKFLYELTTGWTLFVDDAQSTAPFVPAVSAHLVGFTTGMIVGLWKQLPHAVVGVKSRALRDDQRVLRFADTTDPRIG
jgi:hypothetical protein